MTSRQKAYYATLCRLCRELGRPVTAEEIAEVEGVTPRAVRSATTRMLTRGLLAWRVQGKEHYYWPRGWRPLNWPLIQVGDKRKALRYKA